MCERVVEERVRAGLPGVAIQWGGVGDVGVLADTLGEIEVSCGSACRVFNNSLYSLIRK